MEEMDRWSINDLSASTWNNDKHITDAHWILFLLLNELPILCCKDKINFIFYDDIVHNIILIHFI